VKSETRVSPGGFPAHCAATVGRRLTPSKAISRERADFGDQLEVVWDMGVPEFLNRVRTFVLLLGAIGIVQALPGHAMAAVGDVNGDSVVNGRDIHHFTATMTGHDTNAAHMAAADINQDGQLNSADLSAFVAGVLDPGTLPSNTGEWTPPIGIPSPSFGIVETVESIHGSADYYTHYVDASSPASTDSSNPNGTPSRPRKTIPTSVSAGSVVAIAGGTYTSSLLVITAAGTATQPIIIRGLYPDAKPLLKGKLAIEGAARYVIVENIAIDRDYLSSAVNITGPAHHIALRHCDISDAQGGILIYGSANQIVVYDNWVHDCGDLAATSDIDDNGMTVGNASDVWIVDNTVNHVVGSGIVLNPGFGEPNSTIHHIYIGRNTVHHARQSGLWSKQSQDTVFSQNHVHDIIGTSWARSMGMGYQYGPERLWFIANEIHDCEFGIGSGSDSVSNPGRDQYFIGNVIHDIHKSSGGAYDPNNAWEASGISIIGGVNRYVIGNTLYNVDAGINTPGGGLVSISNNIVANVTKPNSHHVYIQDEAGNTNWDMRNNLFYQGGSAASIRFRSTNYTVPQLISSLNKCQACMTADPRFMDEAAGDVHLQANSPAINAGVTPPVYATFQSLYGIDIRLDFSDMPRPQGAAFDIGAFEYMP